MIKNRKMIGMLCLLLGLAGCGNAHNDNTETYNADTVEEQTKPEEADTTPETGLESAEIIVSEDSTETVDSEAEELLQYPLVTTPSSTKNIEFAFDSEGIYCIYNGEKYGYVLPDGKEITEYIYDYATPFSEGLACVAMDGKYGYIDTEGQTVLPFVYDDAAPFSEGLAYFMAGEEYGFMYADGTPAFYLDCDSVSSFSEGLAYFSMDGKYGYINTDGDVVIAPTYFDADYFEDGLAVVSVGGKEGFINSQGEEIVPAIYDSVKQGENFLSGRTGDVYDYYNSDGTRLLPDSYEEIKEAGENYIVKTEGLCGLVDAEGTSLLAPEYELLTWIEGTDNLIAKADGMYGVIDMQGNEQLPFVYDGMNLFSVYESGSEKPLRVSLDDKCGCLSATDFSVQVPIEYDFINGFINGMAVVQLDSLYGIVKADGELYVPVEYKNVSLLENGAVTMKQGDLLTLYNENFEEIYSISGDLIFVSWMEPGYYRVSTDDGYVFLDEKGVQFYNVEFDYAADNVYNNYDADVLVQYMSGTGRDRIIKFEPSEDVDLSDIILQNKITPRIASYWQIVKGERDILEGTMQEGMESSGYGWKEEYRLYCVDGCNSPILYYYATLYEEQWFPMSDSAFFGLDGENVKVLLSGNECGGSMGGNYAVLWREKDTDKILIGTVGHAGGFGGYAYYGEAWEYADGEVISGFSYQTITQPAAYYEEAELLDEPGLFYDGEGYDVPHTAETIMQEGAAVTEFLINEERVSIEEYNEMREMYECIYLD